MRVNYTKYISVVYLNERESVRVCLCLSVGTMRCERVIVAVGSLFHTQYVLIPMTTNFSQIRPCLTTSYIDISYIYVNTHVERARSPCICSFRCVLLLFLCLDIYFRDRLRVVCCFIHSSSSFIFFLHSLVLRSF